MTPAHVGRYHVVGHLASGGMAEILLGKLLGPSGFERPVVIKRILPHLARQESFVQMFLDEAQVVSRIQHPNVVAVHELGKDAGELFLVMEYLEGESLLNLMRRAAGRGERIDVSLAAHVVAQACAGLHAAHELQGHDGTPLGLVHRDVSPSNVFITYSGAVKLLDFGIAKFEARSTETEAGTLKGKFPYMSPEQCLGQKLDRRSDIFSLGIVLFEATTGQRLFVRESSLLTMKAITEEPVLSPRSLDRAYPESLAQICSRALSRDPATRYATAATMRRDLSLAIRELAPAEVPEMALAALMERFFEDRIVQKRELLRRVSAGSDITSIPEPEVDVSVELPTAFEPSQGSGRLVGERSAPQGSGRRGLWAAGALGAATIVALLIALVSASSSSGASSEMEVTAIHTAAAAAPPPGATVIAAPAAITLHVASTPAGATVHVDGEARGVTPLALELAPGATARAIELRREGFEPHVAQFVPSASGRIEAQLAPLSAQPPPAEPPRAEATREVRRPARVRRPRTTSAPTDRDRGGDSPFRRFN